MGDHMPTVVFVSPKGGAGKTTSAMLLGLQLAEHYDVTMIDADPNHPIGKWVGPQQENKPARMTIISDADEDNIIEKIEDAASATPLVVVDLEGTAAKIVVLAVSQADLVIIPSQGSKLDADEAAKAIKVVKQHEKMTRRSLPFGVLLTRTNSAIRTRTTAFVQKTMLEAGVPVFETELNEREAFKGVFSFQKSLSDLDPKEVPNIENAKLNVLEFATEVLAKLKENAASSVKQEVA
jgi:chromosome partitioning protein